MASAHTSFSKAAISRRMVSSSGSGSLGNTRLDRHRRRWRMISPEKYSKCDSLLDLRRLSVFIGRTGEEVDMGDIGDEDVGFFPLDIAMRRENAVTVIMH